MRCGGTQRRSRRRYGYAVPAFGVVVQSSSLGDVFHAFDRGKLDGMTGTLADVLESRDRTGRAPRAFMVLGTSNGTDVIPARAGVETVGAVETIDDVPEEPFDVVALAADELERRARGFRDALAGIRMLTLREQRPLFAPDGPLVAAVEAMAEELRTTGRVRDGGAAADCLAPEPLARAGRRG